MNKNRLKFSLLASLLATGSLGAYAQSPGGVPVAAWWRADASGTLFSDAGITPAADSTQLYQWNDATGHGYNLTQPTAGNRPVFSNAKTLVNFNPSITFNADYMEFAPTSGDSIIGRADGTLYAAGKMSVVGNTGFFGFEASNDFPGLHTYPVNGGYNLLFFANGGPGYQELSHNSFSNNATFIAGAGWVNDGGSAAGYLGATVSLNGDTAVYSGTQMINVNTNAAYGEVRIGWDNNWGALNGQLNELMVFENKLTYPQMQQVESYMAIKYGTTLDSGNVNYVSAAGNTIWSAATNIGNNHNIAGIARDDNGSLYQKQSWSTNTGKQVLIGTMGLANTNADNTGVLADGQYLIWGDNGMDKYPSVAETDIAGTNYRFAAIWKVHNTGSVGTVRVAWPQNTGYASIKLVQSTDSTFTSGNTVNDMTANTQVINGITYNYADVTLEDGQYFTFGVQVQSPGGIATLPAVWYRPDNVDSSKWKDVSINTLDLSVQSGSITVNAGDANHNFNSWTTGYSSSNYYNYIDSNASNTDIETNPVFGNYNTNSYLYTPLTVFGVARPTSTGNSSITGIDNETGNGAEPALAIKSLHPQFYRFSNGIDQTAASLTATINQTSIFSSQPYPGASGSPAGNLIIGLNGKDTVIANQNGSSSIAGPYLKIGYSAFGFGAFQGDIQEVIWYKAALNTADMQKVETYFALKYGTTLAHNYMNAVGDTLYNLNTTDSAYHYNIAGIGSEAANGGLNQRQSNSVNTGKQVLISTTGLANTNDSNTTSLTEGQYLVWGDNGLSKTPAVAISDISGINFRFGSVWKVQNTANVGTVRVAWTKTAFNKFVLIQSGDATFATGNTATDMTTNVITVNGTQYQYADVTLTDGQYFTFGAYVQAPGGVADGLMMWHKADDSVTLAGPKDQWMDFSGNDMTITQMNDTSHRPTLVTDAVDSADNVAYTFNFNPFYHFDGSDFFYKDNAAYFPTTTSGGSSFSVSYNPSTGGFNTIYGWGDDDPNLVRGGDDYYAYYNNGSPNITKDVGATRLNANIGGMLWKPAQAANVDNAFYFLLNGQVDTTSNFGFGNLNDANNFAIGSEGFGLTGNGNELYTGGIAEVFAYSKDYQNDTTDALLRINSYLAIKYGITLKDKTGMATSSYLSSQSDTVWNATDNIGYNNNIAGLAHDVPSALDQKQSVSENTNMQQVLIGTLSMDNTNSANMNSLSDGQFLLWGDNGAARAPSRYDAGLGHDVNLLFASIWKAQNTGTVGTVRIAWPQQYNTLSLVQSSDTTFDNSDTYTDMTANTITINGKVYNYADVTLSNGQYFTFATKLEHAPGGVFAGLNLWYRADKDAVNTGDSTEVTSWTDFAAGTVANQVGTNEYPLYHEGSASYLNFNPGINFTGANQSLGNLLVQVVADTSYDIFTLTKEGITFGGSNARIFSVLANRSLTTGNIHYWDGIGINYDSRVERYNTTSGLSYLGNPGNINFANNSPSIMGYTFTDHKIIKGLNGAVAGTPANSGPYGIIDGGFTFGSTVFSGNGSDNYSLKGSIGETIVYGSRNLSPVERNKINSYLAIKYGITMDTASSYITADSTLVWDKDADQDFYHNIAGIGRDDISALYQKQSRSQITNNPNDEVAIGLGDIYATNLDNTDSIANGQFLVWGDNGNTQAMTNTASTYAALIYNGSSDNRRMKRIWKVRNTGVDKTLKLRFPIASVGTTTITGEDACSNYAIVYASDSAFTSNVVVAPLNVNGTDYEALRGFPQGTSYFTFAKVLDVAAGIVVLPASTQTTTEYNQCATDGWRYFNQSGVPADKLLSLKGMNNTQLDNLTITISPTGANYDDGSIVTKVMPRVSTVTDASASTYSGVDVRVYYSDTELSNTQLTNAIANSWVKYEGDAGDAIADIQDDGIFTQGMASELSPDSTGMEDGVRFAEFHNVGSFSSFLYVSSSQPIGIVLPIRLLSFTAVRNNQSVLLNWSTASEQDSKGFVIERSTDGAQWISLGFTTSKAESGNSTAPLSYAYTDPNPVPAKNFYRLKEVSMDGKYEYSEIRIVDFNNAVHISIYPNPVKESVTITGLKGHNTIYVSNSLGQVLIREAAAADTKELSTAQLAPGIYMITVQDENNSSYNFKMVKQ